MALNSHPIIVDEELGSGVLSGFSTDGEGKYSPASETEPFPLFDTQGHIDGTTHGYKLGDHATSSEFLITWIGPNDPANPLNWSKRRKYLSTVLVSLFTFISPYSSTMMATSLPKICDEFNIPAGYMQQLVMTIFMLGYAQGPFVLAPLSEIYGRMRILQGANLIYLIFNTACGFAQTKQQMMAFRFLSGIGGSAPQAIGSGILADIWCKDERGKGQSIYGVATWIGPCLAPICGAFISSHTSWRWIFLSTSAFTVLVQLVALVFLRETYAPTILARKADRLRKAIAQRGFNPDHTAVKTEYDTGDRMTQLVRRRLVLPFIMMFTHPATQVPSLYRAFCYGVMYLLISTFPLVFEGVYKQPTDVASLNYLSLMGGFLIGLQLSGVLIDGLYAHLKTEHKLEEGPPEWRIPPMLLGGLLAPLGFFIYGFTAHYHMHWIGPNVGCVVLGMGLIIAMQANTSYTTDAYSPKYIASAAAVGAFLRTMCGFSFPLFAPRLFASLGVGWGNGVLGFVALGMAVVNSVVLWVWGLKLREWSFMGLPARERI